MKANASSSEKSSSGSPLALREAQAIAERIVGEIQWHGAYGWCTCPAVARHTTPGGQTDCKVVCQPIPQDGGTLAPGLYCFHGSCAQEIEAASFALRSALGKRTTRLDRHPRRWNRGRGQLRLPKPVFDPARLARVAATLPGVDAGWLRARSASLRFYDAPSAFLQALYQPGERVVVFDVFKSQGQAVWTCPEPGEPPDHHSLDDFRRGRPHGVWFLANPVTGEFTPNDQGRRSRRSWQSVTAWRYLVLESDLADAAHWLSALALMPLRIVAIYTSGGKSIHALVRLDAESKADWDARVRPLTPALVKLGADRKAISAVRLTRLPGCERGEKQAMQTLLFINPAADETPICELELTHDFE